MVMFSLATGYESIKTVQLTGYISNFDTEKLTAKFSQRPVQNLRRTMPQSSSLCCRYLQSRYLNRTVNKQNKEISLSKTYKKQLLRTIAIAQYLNHLQFVMAARKCIQSNVCSPRRPFPTLDFIRPNGLGLLEKRLLQYECRQRIPQVICT